MGHRALVARERADGRHDVHRSQWGSADLSLARRLADEDWPPDGVDPAPTAAGVTWPALLAEHLDPLCHEAVFVAQRSGPVRAYRPLWIGEHGADAGESGGLLVAVDHADRLDDARVIAWVAGARAVARAACEAGPLEPTEAATLLEQRLRAWADDREVIRVPRAAPA